MENLEENLDIEYESLRKQLVDRKPSLQIVGRRHGENSKKAEPSKHEIPSRGKMGRGPLLSCHVTW
jgi:hypothetical protein